MPRTSTITPEKFTTFGDLLRFLRRKADLTQRELSIAVGYSESQISRLEQNERAPDEATLAARFVPALYLEDEPGWVARLLELGSATHSHTSKADVLQPVADAKPTPHNLPIQLTSFIGREKEIIEIKRLFSKGEGSVRLLTLTGHGGCGKTRLALQAASGLLDAFPEGVWLIELAPLSDPALVPQTVAAVLGLKEEVGRPVLSTLIDHLRGKHVLFILDNCEHLAQASAQLMAALLQACPNLSLLATSREILGMAGERTLYVSSLSVPDSSEMPLPDALSQYEAVRLFVDRALIALPDFTLNPDNASAVMQICQRLDGIPLALELAATRVKVLRVEQIAARLANAFRLLTGGNRTALPRHQTLQATVDWSYDLLSEAERRVFVRLSVFTGGWTLDAAEAVCAGGGIQPSDVLDLLTQLVFKSLVIAERSHGREARYRLLETVRQYALSKLAESGEADTVRRLQVEYFITFAETDPGTRTLEPLWLNRLELEHDNLRAALTWSLSTPGAAELGLRLAGLMGPFWGWRGYWNEMHNWLKLALAQADAEGVNSTPARAQVLLGLADGLGLGDHAIAQTLMTQSLKIYDELGDKLNSAYVLFRMGWLAREHDDSDTARLRFEESLSIYRDLDDKPGMCVILVSMGEVAVMQKDTIWATALLEEGLTLSREVGITLMTGWALNHLGHVAQLRNEWERARQLHEASLVPFNEIGARHEGTIWAHQGLGETALAQGDATLAAMHFTLSLVLCRDLGDPEGLSFCLAGFAGVAALHEEPERAAWLWGAAEALRQSIGTREAPASHATHERLKAEVRWQLGGDVFNAKWAEGQAVSVENAIVEAIG